MPDPVGSKTAIVIGAGPAGLTAAYELLQRAPHIKPVVYEMSEALGGIARTVNYKGNRIDIGGHRFFSKSGRVLKWWQNILPLETTDERRVTINYQNKTTSFLPTGQIADPQKTDKVMLVRHRLSRIFFEGKFFEYPVTLNKNTLANLGLARILKIAAGYVRARLAPRPEKSLEDFFINRFGRELYLLFFKDYTEKVWGVPCAQILPEWGSQRVKSLSISRVLKHMLGEFFPFLKDHRKVATSLIHQFLYPKLGPGQMWEEVAAHVRDGGGEIHLRHQIVGLAARDEKIVKVKIRDLATGLVETRSGDYFFSTMPVKELIAALEPPAPPVVRETAQGLEYRDFVTVGLLLRQLNNKDIARENWIYIQEKKVKVGRLQIFNNWSPYLVKDPGTMWVGLEYFCCQGDALWSKSDRDFLQFAIDELVLMGMIRAEDVLDGTVIRMPKAYPAYTGTYPSFHLIRDFTDRFENLFLIGRNGMHKYNNQDHSMLAAMTAVDNIVTGNASKDNLWAINMEDDFQESD
ncbi:MAG: NAD(P)/FAD-dependent oxidoreductase [Candidatus Omnitrophica bacterium]|nr:NAD(P)/FAD-dependent oxidoreductase [Candidatus Omnitrophota bacterium]